MSATGTLVTARVPSANFNGRALKRRGVADNQLPQPPRWFHRHRKGYYNDLKSLRRTSEFEFSEHRFGQLFARYRMALYFVFVAATALSVAGNWNWLTGAEVFRIMAALSWRIHDAHVHEARDLKVILRAALPGKRR